MLFCAFNGIQAGSSTRSSKDFISVKEIKSFVDVVFESVSEGNVYVNDWSIASKNNETIVELLETKDLNTFKTIISKQDDELYKILYPPRTKRDLGLRRCRFNDYTKYMDDELCSWLFSQIGADYIFTLNRLAAKVLNDDKWNEAMKPLMTLDIMSFSKCADILNSKLKSSNCPEGWQKYAEAKNLTGHRLAPWPGFDAAKDVEELATGGVEKYIIGGFKLAARRYLRPQNEQQQLMTFIEFVKSDKWITHGSSSEGKLFYEYKGKEFKVRLRKNMVNDVLDLDKLAEECLATTMQRSTAFIKEETGKCRIAVCSDLKTYLKMAFFIYSTGYAYKKWPDVARNYNSKKKIDMMREIINLCKRGYYGMAWDYAGFERQVKTTDMIDILETMVEGIQKEVANTQVREEILAIGKDIIEGLNNSIIVDLDGKVHKVTGGLPSGLYITSIVGDGYNKTISDYCLELLRELNINDVIKHNVITGDDSSFMAFKSSTLQLLDYLMTLTGAVASRGKFGITKEATEFLRVSYSSAGARGYILRAIPSLIQRKPWNDEPLDRIDQLKSQLEAYNTVIRRGGKDIGLDNRFIGMWAKRRAIKKEVITAPIAKGGLGLGRITENVKVIYTERGVEKSKISFNFLNSTDWRRDLQIKRAKEFGIVLDTIDAKRIADEELSEITLGNSIGEVTKSISEELDTYLVAKYRGAKIERQTKLMPIINKQNLERDNVMLREQGSVKNLSTFGIFAKDKGEYSLLRRYSRYTETPFRELARMNFPEISNTISKMRYLTREDAERWVFGDLSTSVGILNPIITEVMTSMIANQIHVGNVPKGRLQDVWTAINRMIFDKNNLTFLEFSNDFAMW